MAPRIALLSVRRAFAALLGRVGRRRLGAIRASATRVAIRSRASRRLASRVRKRRAVTVIAQGTSYAVFAVLVLTVLSWLPQAALLIGAAFGAVIGYCGHRFLSFAPKKPHTGKAGA